MEQTFKTMDEMVAYLGALEERIKTLEAQNATALAVPPKAESMDGNVIARYVARSLPQTNLLSPGFFQRAFAVWGHFFVANLIIGIGFAAVYFCLVMVIFGSFLGRSR